MWIHLHDELLARVHQWIITEGIATYEESTKTTTKVAPGKVLKYVRRIINVDNKRFVVTFVEPDPDKQYQRGIQIHFCFLSPTNKKAKRIAHYSYFEGELIHYFSTVGTYP